jgi:Fic family protein
VGDRDSREVGGGQLAVVSDEERAPREAKNAYEQVRRLEEHITAAVGTDYFRLRPSMLMELNRIAVDGLVSAPGRYRLGAMTIPESHHQPPIPTDVPALVEEMCEYVNDHWEKPALHLAAYVMWRLNWIHPFQDGNGRTARASSYLVLCARLGYDLPGRDTMLAHIAGDKPPYYTALEAADAAHSKGRLDLSVLEGLLEELLIKQIRHAATSPMDGARPKRATSGPQALAPSKAVAVPERAEPATHTAAWIGAGATVVAALIALVATCAGGAGG